MTFLIRQVKIGQNIDVYTDRNRVATVRKKYQENEIFSRSWKSQGTLWMAREI